MANANIASGTNGWLNAKDFGASGSEFETTGKTQAGSDALTVENVGDFAVGQEVAVYDCHRHYYGMIYNVGKPCLAKNQRPLEDEIEFRGLNNDKRWQTFVISFEKTDQLTFRWMVIDPRFQTLSSRKPIFNRLWEWQGEDLPVNGDWFELIDGVEARFRKRDWRPGECVSFHARNRLLARIVEIRDKTLFLSAKVTLDASNARIRHHDQTALQAALDAAVASREGLFIPAGRYHLSTGLWIKNASTRIEGASRELTTLDVSDDHTAAFWIAGGKEISIRNLGMIGHTGFQELPSHRQAFKTSEGFNFWPTANQQMEIKGCSAVNVVGTEHLIFEDLKVTRMASEAFYSHSADRYGTPAFIQAPHEGMPELHKQYTKSCVFHRCHVSDCGFNAFNNNDFAENTSILHCHVERVANFCENASRFTRIIGNYCSDCTATGTHSGSAADPRKIGTSQVIFADNVFEAGTFLGGISVGNDATQVTIANNLFIGYGKESAITILGGRRVIVTGNHIDLTQLEGCPDNERCGIQVEASNVLIADNQIYVRGERSDKTTGIHIADHAVNVHLHDNLIENCQCGLRSGRRVYAPKEGEANFEFRHTEAKVEKATGPRSCLVNGVPLPCDTPHPYQGWNLRWLTGDNANQTFTIAKYDPLENVITLNEAVAMTAGDAFVIWPRRANWRIHHNTIVDCERPTLIDLLETDGVHIEDNAT